MKPDTPKSLLYFSYVPHLLEVLSKRRPKKVIEIGCGVVSTPLLWESCDVFASFETDPVWVKSTNDLMFELFSVTVVQPCEDYLNLPTTPCDLLFLDGPTRALDRVPILEAWANDAEVIVMHDCDPDAGFTGMRALDERAREIAAESGRRYDQRPWPKQGTGIIW